MCVCACVRACVRACVCTRACVLLCTGTSGRSATNYRCYTVITVIRVGTVFPVDRGESLKFFTLCVYANKIRDDNFGGCKKSFSWLGQKVYTNVFVFDSIFDSHSKFRGYSIRYSIRMKFQTRPSLILCSGLQLTISTQHRHAVCTHITQYHSLRRLTTRPTI